MQSIKDYQAQPEKLQNLRIHGIRQEEKETVIVFSDRSGTATVSTTDNAVFNTLKKRGAFRLVRLNWGRAAEGQELHEAIFEGPANLIRFVNPVEKRPLTEAQREALKHGKKFQPKERPDFNEDNRQ